MIIQDSSNISNQEFFRLNGCLTPERIESLLEYEGRLDVVKGIGCHVKEAMGCFPAEDFLAGAIERLNNMVKRLRGENKAELLGCIEALDDIAQCTFNSADYGRDELRQALKSLK